MADEILEVKEGVVLDREGNEISRPDSDSGDEGRERGRTGGAAGIFTLNETLRMGGTGTQIRVWRMGSLAWLFIPVFLLIALAVGLAVAAVLLLGFVLTNIVRLFSSPRKH